MKKLLLILNFVLFSFGANAINIESLYKNCKPYQNNGFVFENLSKSQINNAVSCFSYLGGVRDNGVRNCVVMNAINERKYVKKKELKIISSLVANASVKNNTLITSFINFAENNTEKWEHSVSVYFNKFLSEKFPCKIDN